MDKKQLLLTYAMAFLGIPYVWGGESPQAGFDCSGFVQECLKSIGLDPVGDQTAQGLHNHFIREGKRCAPESGALIFFGSSLMNITHVAIALSDWQMIEAGGGGSKNTDLDAAIRYGGFVRIRPIAARADFVTAIMPSF